MKFDKKPANLSPLIKETLSLLVELVKKGNLVVVDGDKHREIKNVGLFSIKEDVVEGFAIKLRHEKQIITPN